MKESIWTIILLLFYGAVFGQGKVIEGDTSSWYRWQQPIHQKLGLKDFFKSKDEFNFRFQNHGQIIEISKNGEQFTGVLVNYVFREAGRRNISKDTLYNSIILSNEKVKTVFDLLQELEMRFLPSEEDIEDWNWGFDGVTYILEYADPSKYAYKSYWTPSVQDSLKEAEIVLTFVDKLSQIVDLEQNRQDFENTWPRSGCYSSGGLMSCFISNYISLGFLGSSKFPYGFKVSSHISHIGRKTLNTNLTLAYQEDKSNGTVFRGGIGKSTLFIRKKGHRDFTEYIFTFRNLNFLETPTSESKSHLLYYGMNIPKLRYASWKIGANMIESETNYTGVFLGFHKWFSSINININGQCSIFSDQINFKIGVSRSFNLRKVKVVRWINTRLYYEQFFDYRDVNLGLSVSL